MNILTVLTGEVGPEIKLGVPCMVGVLMVTQEMVMAMRMRMMSVILMKMRKKNLMWRS